METLEEQSLVFLKKKVEEHDLEVVWFHKGNSSFAVIPRL